MLELKGKPVADRIYENLKKYLASGLRKPHLVVLLVGSDPASEVYVSHKQTACKNLGYQSTLVKLEANISAQDLKAKIQELNQDSQVDAILLQLPLPAHLDAHEMTETISPLKDADGLTTASLGALASGRYKIASCTPSGVMQILKFYELSVARKNVLVIGRSLIVGLPLFHLLNQAQATVTLAHSKTENLQAQLQNYDFVFVAAGKPHLFSAHNFKKSTVVVDIGMHRTAQGLIGDVNPERAGQHLAALTPVPGGVGPMTIAMLMFNTFLLAHPQITSDQILQKDQEQ